MTFLLLRCGYSKDMDQEDVQILDIMPIIDQEARKKQKDDIEVFNKSPNRL